MHFTLRPFKTDDVESLVSCANNPNIAMFMTDQFPYPYSIEKGKAFIENATKDNPLHIFAIDIDGKASGGIGIHPQEDIQSKNAELGYWLAEPFWGQGIMTRAIIEMLDYGFKQFDINRVFARPFGSNRGSQKALQKAGFVLEAHFIKTIFKNGAFEDELVYAVRM
jgi:RimJ/RimL family protein N-acetyltransferase